MLGNSNLGYKGCVQLRKMEAIHPGIVYISIELPLGL